MFAAGRGKPRHKGRGKHYTTEADREAEAERERKEKEWRVSRVLFSASRHYVWCLVTPSKLAVKFSRRFVILRDLISRPDAELHERKRYSVFRVMTVKVVLQYYNPVMPKVCWIYEEFRSKTLTKFTLAIPDIAAGQYVWNYHLEVMSWYTKHPSINLYWAKRFWSKENHKE